MTSRKKIGLIAGAGMGAAAAAALRRRWSRAVGSEPHGAVGDGAVADAAASSFLTHLSAAVQIPTVSVEEGVVDGPVFERFRAFLATTYPLVHEVLDREVVADHSLLFTWEGSGDGPPILLMAHQDVVPIEGGTEADWPTDPFSGEIIDGFLWGRGALDDKGSLIAIFEAVESLLAEGYRPDVTIYFAFGHDEEIGGLGAEHIAALMKERGVRLRYVLDEGGAVVDGIVPGASSPIGLVGIGEKSSVDLILRAEAPGGHSSLPTKESAIGALARAITAVESNPMPARMAAQHPFMEATAKAMGGLGGKVLSKPRIFGSLIERRFSAVPETDAQIRTTAAVTIVNGGVKDNVMPQEATAIVNVRIIPGDTAKGVLAHFRGVVGTDASVYFDEAAFGGDPPPVSDHLAPSFAEIASVVERTFPGTIVAPYVLTGATDSRFFYPVADNVYRFVPFLVTKDELSTIHGTGERVRVSHAAAAVRFYRDLIETTASR